MVKDSTRAAIPPAEGDPEPQADSPELADRVSAEDYTTTGKTRVATRRGYAYNTASNKFPTIHSDGILVSADDAKSIVDESDGRVHIVADDQEGGE